MEAEAQIPDELPYQLRMNISVAFWRQDVRSRDGDGASNHFYLPIPKEEGHAVSRGSPKIEGLDATVRDTRVLSFRVSTNRMKKPASITTHMSWDKKSLRRSSGATSNSRPNGTRDHSTMTYQPPEQQ